MDNWLHNITDKDILQDNLTFASMYIAVYEYMTDHVESYIKDFLCDYCIKDGKEHYKETPSYHSEIKQRVVDEKGNKDRTKASFLWLVDNDAISQDDYNTFLAAKEVRNRYAHELTNVILYGITEREILLFFELYALFQKINKWFFINIEAPIIGEDLPNDADLESVLSAADIVFDTVINVLYNGKSEDYKSIIAEAESIMNGQDESE